MPLLFLLLKWLDHILYLLPFLLGLMIMIWLLLLLPLTFISIFIFIFRLLLFVIQFLAMTFICKCRRAAILVLKHKLA